MCFYERGKVQGRGKVLYPPHFQRGKVTSHRTLRVVRRSIQK